MGMLDRFRRRRADTPVPPLWTVASPDGGWRDVAPIAPVLRRTDTRVAPGLPFRDDLASWQDVTFGTPLGHAVTPSAPVGTMHGVIRYRTPGPSLSPGGGRLLLLRSYDAGAVPEEPEVAAPVVAHRPVPGRIATVPVRTPPVGTGSVGVGPARALPVIRSTVDTASDDSVSTVRHEIGEPVARRAVADAASRPLLADGTPAGHSAETTTAELTTPPVQRTSRPHATRSGIGEPLTSMPSTAVLSSNAPSRPGSPTTGVMPPGSPAADVPMPVSRSVAAASASGARPTRGSVASMSAESGVGAGASPSGERPLSAAGGVSLPVADTSPTSGRPSPHAAAGAVAGASGERPSPDSAAADVPLPIARASSSPPAAAPPPANSPGMTGESASGERPLLGSAADTSTHPGTSADAVPTGERPSPDSATGGAPLPIAPAAPRASSASSPAMTTDSVSGERPVPDPAAAGVPLPIARAVARASSSGERPSSPAADASRRSGPGVGAAPDRVMPLLTGQGLVRPAVTSNSPPDRVAHAVWRRPSATHAATTVRPIKPPSGESGHGVDIVAMAPVRPPALPGLPVSHVQRTPRSAGPPRPRSASAPPAFDLSPTVKTVAERPSGTTKSPPGRSPKPDPLDGIEMDKLARQLFEPISRLLRADLRRGRERAGAGQDHRH